MNSTPKEALDACHRSRVRRRRWPRVLFWASVCVVVLHLVLVVLMSAGVAIWLNPGLSILLLPSGFLLLVGLPIVAAFLLGFLAFNGRRLTRTARVLLIVQVILLVGIRVWLHLTTDGIFCKQLQVWSFRHAGGPKLQAWAISVLNDSVKQKGLLNEPAGDFLDCLGDAGTKWASVKGGSSEAIALPSWIRAGHPNVVFIHRAGSNSYIAILTSGGFGTQGFILGASVPKNEEFDRMQKLLPGVYYGMGE